MSERVEWVIGRKLPDGTLETVNDGAQSVFGMSRAEKVAEKLGPPWGVFHSVTREPLEAIEED